MGAYAKEHTFWCTTNWFAELSARCPGNNVYFFTGLGRLQLWIVRCNIPQQKKQLIQNCYVSGLLKTRTALLAMGAVDVESLQQQQQVEDASLRRIILDALPREKSLSHSCLNTVLTSRLCMLQQWKKQRWKFQPQPNLSINVFQMG